MAYSKLSTISKEFQIIQHNSISITALKPDTSELNLKTILSITALKPDYHIDYPIPRHTYLFLLEFVMP